MRDHRTCKYNWIHCTDIVFELLVILSDDAAVTKIEILLEQSDSLEMRKATKSRKVVWLIWVVSYLLIFYCVWDILVLPAENYVDPVGQWSVLLWNWKPCLSTHDHHILLACRIARLEFGQSFIQIESIHRDCVRLKLQFWRGTHFFMLDVREAVFSKIHSNRNCWSSYWPMKTTVCQCATLQLTCAMMRIDF